MEDFNYELKTPFKYHHKGQEQEAKFITLFAPTMEHMKHREPLKQAFYQAVLDLNTGNTNEEKPQPQSEDEMKGDDILVILRASQKVDTFKLGLHFIQLLTSKGIAMVDGSEPMTDSIVKKLKPEDFDNLMGAFFVNFIVASL